MDQTQISNNKTIINNELSRNPNKICANVGQMFLLCNSLFLCGATKSWQGN